MMEKPIVPEEQPPNSWLYAISSEFAETDYVPPEAVKGAWRVNDNRQIEGDFTANDNFIPGLKYDLDWPLYLEPIAKNHANGWVYDIDKEYRAEENVPKSRIKGSWKVDENGKILPVFFPNENYIQEEDT